MVLAQLALVAGRRHAQVVERIAVQQRARVAVFVMHAGGQRRTVSAHEACDVGAGDLAVREQLECAQHGIVEECAALHHDGAAQIAGVAQLDDLVQRVAHHGVAQACSDVFDGRAFLLRLFDRGVHEHCATRTQIHRVRGGERRLGEVLDAQVHARGEGLQERAAAGGARFVDGDGFDDAVVDGEVFHVLPTDVDDGGDAGADELGATVMRHRLDHAFVNVQAGGDESLAVTGGAGTRNVGVVGQLGFDLLDDLRGGEQGAALVRAIAGPHDVTIVVDERGLDGRRTCVNAQEQRPMGVLHRALGDELAVMAFVEFTAFGVILEQRTHRLVRRGLGLKRVKPRQQLFDGGCNHAIGGVAAPLLRGNGAGSVGIGFGGGFIRPLMLHAA